MPAQPAVEAAAPRKRAVRARPQAVRVRPPVAMSLPFLAVDPAQANRLLANAIGFSVLLHMVVLALHFSPIELPTFDRGPPLEVALVNAKSQSKPTKADILAQAHLDGGGNTDANRRAKTPLPVLPAATTRRRTWRWPRRRSPRWRSARRNC